MDDAYIRGIGDAALRRHAEDFVRKRLAPAFPQNDGRQTPMRGHPVFIAQHATGACCRSCLEKWHGIKRGAPLAEEETRRVVEMLLCWVREQFPVKTDLTA